MAIAVVAANKLRCQHNVFQDSGILESNEYIKWEWQGKMEFRIL